MKITCSNYAILGRDEGLDRFGCLDFKLSSLLSQVTNLGRVMKIVLPFPQLFLVIYPNLSKIDSASTKGDIGLAAEELYLTESYLAQTL